jgi:hypothetical protein
MSWFKTGYESAKEAYEDFGDGDQLRRHWQPPETTNRLLFLEDDPFLFWEHNLKLDGHWKNWFVCPKRNKIEGSCAICDKYEDRYPYFIGMHSVINMTPWTSKKGNVYNFQREIFAARLGGKDKPGVLKKLERLKQKHGRLRGLVVDVYRSGAKTESCGDEFEVMEKVSPADIAGLCKDRLTQHLVEINKGVDPEKVTAMDTLLKRNPWESFNFEEIIKPKSNVELRQLISTAPAEPASSFRDDGGGSGKDALDDDIPY